MPLRFDLPDTVPLFPLPGALLLPRAQLPLQIFEPRYLQMTEDALKTPGRLIGMIQPIGEGLAVTGTAGRISGFQETEDGRMLITLRAISRFRLMDVQDGFHPYLRGQVDWAPFAHDLDDEETDPGFDRDALLSRLSRFMDLHELSTDWDAAQQAAPELLVNSLSMLLPFEPEEKQALLEALHLPERRELLDGLLEYHLHSVNHDETLQ